MSIILASSSPRRQELLRLAVRDFIISPADVDETIPDNIAAENAAEFLAVKKAKAVSASHQSDTVIGCDTIVLLGGTIMGKPADENDARNMLHALSGKSHRVITGICIIANGKSLSFSQTTEVEFYNLTDDEIDDYISTKDPFDKAGAYGIQTQGGLLVKQISGDYFNVVGLPVAKLKRILMQMKLI